MQIKQCPVCKNVKVFNSHWEKCQKVVQVMIDTKEIEVYHGQKCNVCVKLDKLYNDVANY